MAKETVNESANGGGGRPGLAIHLILQGKGGVGKSVVASWLAEFLIKRGQNVRCIDGDPVNRSLGQYAALRADKLDLVNSEGLVQRTRYDALLERFASEDAVFVLDSGATAFLPFWTYAVETKLIDVVRGVGRQIYIHVPISGGEMLNDTLLGFRTLAESTSGKSLIVWINEYFGPVAREGKPFEQMQVCIDNYDKVLASIGIPQRSADTYGETIRRMREKKLTFDEAIESPEFMLAERSRLHIAQTDLFSTTGKGGSKSGALLRVRAAAIAALQSPDGLCASCPWRFPFMLRHG